VVSVLIWKHSFSKADCKSWNEYRGAFDAAFAEVGQGAVRVRQRVFLPNDELCRGHVKLDAAPAMACNC
jgi:hypothetical protein